MRHAYWSLLVLIPLALSAGCADGSDDSGPCVPVTIADGGVHWSVVLDYGCGLTRREMGYRYAEALAGTNPELEAVVDGYLAEQCLGVDAVHGMMMDRVADVLPQVDPELRDELEGMIEYYIEEVNGGVEPPSAMGDGVLGRTEFYFLNLFPDIGRTTACSGVAVFGSRSVTGEPIVLRILDWDGGAENQLNQIQAITTIKNGARSLHIVGYLGMLSIITGFNDDGLFAGILDAPTGAAFPSGAKSSYVFDLRYALESFATMDELAAHLTDASRIYGFNHLVLLADTESSTVLENNVSGDGTAMRRALRSWDSELNPGITWGFADAIGVVNSFLLAGNHDNHTGNSSNEGRFDTLKAQLESRGEAVDREALTAVAHESTMYREATQHIVVYEPVSRAVEVFFHPRVGENPAVPAFTTVELPF